jgi:hypothetical protein
MFKLGLALVLVLQIGGLPRGVGGVGELGIEAGAIKERDTNLS